MFTRPPAPQPEAEGEPGGLSVEEEREISLRYVAFRTLGFDHNDAYALALSHTSMSAARELINHGCEPHMAARILL